MSQTETFYIESLGCIANRVDTTRVRHFFVANGWTPLDGPEAADLIVLMTCAVTEAAENYNIERLKDLKKSKSLNSRIIVGGCLPSINGPKLAQVFDGLVFSPRTLARLDSYFQAQTSIECVSPTMDEAPNDSLRTIRISTGCMSRCTYCAIPFANGRTKSRSIDAILSDMHEAEDDGYDKVKLVSEDIGAYGLDGKQSIVDLLVAIRESSLTCHVYLDTFNLNWFFLYLPHLLDLLRDTRFIKSFCLPIQSGSDRILGLMKREYTIEQARCVLDSLLRSFPEAKLSTDFIVGFPSETLEDFEASLAVLREYKFSYTQIFTYGERPRTAANNLTPKVSDEEKERRRQLLFSATMEHFFSSNGIRDSTGLKEVLEDYRRLPVNFNLVLQ